MTTENVVPLTDIADLDDDVAKCGVTERVEASTERVMSRDGGTQQWLVDLVRYFKKWGVRYQLVEGYESRGRPTSSGGFDPDGLQIHHTGTTSTADRPHPSLNTLVHGRSDLPGPLCQIATGFDGVTYVVALGRANHAGMARPHGALPGGDGNRLRVGNEVQTSGTQVMPAVQVEGIIRSSAAVLDMLGVAPDDVADHLCRHYDTSVTGKWDLGAGTGRHEPLPFRPIIDAVAALLRQGPTPKPPPKPPVTGTDPVKVKALQALLRVDVDGMWGDQTDEAARRMRKAARAHFGHPRNIPSEYLARAVQRVLRVEPDGIVGPKTKAALQAWVRDTQKVLRVGVDGWWGEQTDRAFLKLRATNKGRW